MKITTVIYKMGISIYTKLPAKYIICKLLKLSKIPIGLVYKDLKFNSTFKVKVRDNVSFKMVSYGGRIENEIFWNGLFNSFENETGWIWKILAKESEVIFDIGANTGIYSLTAKALNSKAKVVAFEPSTNTFNKLVKNNDINNYDIVCAPIALSDESGYSIFYDSYNTNQTSASLSPEMKKNFGPTKMKEYLVRTKTLKSYIQENNIGRVDLIKIDVEMFEPYVIYGFGDLLVKYKPNIIIEILSEDVAHKLNSIFKKDFVFYHLHSENKLVQVEELKVVPLKWNYFVCHKENQASIEKKVSLIPL